MKGDEGWAFYYSSSKKHQKYITYPLVDSHLKFQEIFV